MKSKRIGVEITMTPTIRKKLSVILDGEYEKLEFYEATVLYDVSADDIRLGKNPRSITVDLGDGSRTGCDCSEKEYEELCWTHHRTIHDTLVGSTVVAVMVNGGCWYIF